VTELSKHQPQVGEAYLDYVAVKDRELLVAWDKAQIVGIACVSYRPRDRSANIDQVYVHPAYRRWGIATRLVNQAIVCAGQMNTRTIFAQAPVTNPVLLVYLKAGFRVSGFLDTYLPPGGDGLVTALYLAYDLA
jgi:GNAT superfamily N-acetyltransferase